MKLIRKVLVLLVVGIMWCASGLAAELLDRTVAVVNRKVITLYELEQAMQVVPENELSPDQSLSKRERVLHFLIENELVRQKVAQEAIVVDEEAVADTLADIKQRNNVASDADLKLLLGREGKTLEEFEQEIREQLQMARLVNREVHSQVTITEEDVQAEFQTRQGQLANEPPTVEIEYILLAVDEYADETVRQATRERAKALVQELRAGADFAALAAEYSDHPSAQTGGLLGVFRQGELAAPLDQTFDMHVGEISEPLPTATGFHIIKVRGKQSAAEATFDKLKDGIRRRLLEEKSQTLYREWIDQLRAEAYIDIQLD